MLPKPHNHISYTSTTGLPCIYGGQEFSEPFLSLGPLYGRVSAVIDDPMATAHFDLCAIAVRQFQPRHHPGGPPKGKLILQKRRKEVNM